MQRRKVKAGKLQKNKNECSPRVQCIVCGVEGFSTTNIYNHLKNTHNLTTAHYRKLETGDVCELEDFQKRNGFTGVPGQCGYCLAYFESKNNKKLAKHQTTCIKNPALNCERKGFDMNLMRKLRDEGHFRNSMLAEIEEDELDKIIKDVDVIQKDLKEKIQDAEDKGAVLDPEEQLRQQMEHCTVKAEFEEN